MGEKPSLLGEDFIGLQKPGPQARSESEGSAYGPYAR